nr:glycosyltransferase family 4 protein [Patulibacter sp. SYSU D01012]
MGANIVCTPRRLPPAPPRYLWVGLEWERKNGRRVVEAFRELAIPGAELHLVGEHPAVDVPGVIGHGRVRDRERLRALFEGATAFVMPSTTEPFGIAYAEAATAGVPSLGTTVGGAADAIGDGGLLVDPHDGRAIREAMAALAQPATHAALAAKAERHGAWARWDGVAERMATALLAA